MAKKASLDRPRKSFRNSKKIIELPYLIELQKDSYMRFLQRDKAPDKRDNFGLEAVFRRSFPVISANGEAELHFCGFQLSRPEFTMEECVYRGLTYASPLKMMTRLILRDIDEDTGEQSVREIKEQNVYLGDMPDMTENGTFVVNGVERVVVSQVHRCPGLFCDGEVISGVKNFTMRLIPYTGSWLDFVMDARGLLFIRVDRRKKFLLSTFLLCLEKKSKYREEKGIKEYVPIEDKKYTPEGYSVADILAMFYKKVELSSKGDNWTFALNPELLADSRLNFDLVDAKKEKIVIAGGKKLNKKILERFKAKGISECLVNDVNLTNGYFAESYCIKVAENNEVDIKVGDRVTEEALNILKANEYKKIALFDAGVFGKDPCLCATFAADKNKKREEALVDMHSIMRPGDPATVVSGEKLLYYMVFDPNSNDLSVVGRKKLNDRLGLDIPATVRVLTTADIMGALAEYLNLIEGKTVPDDIDNLSNRRIRAVGEMLENYYQYSMARVEKIIKERLNVIDVNTLMPNDLINMRPASAAAKDFFGSSQLSQFMDQTNPLSEVTHKRRISALGLGGLSRDRAGFAVRDVHPTHYGRICPIETPEGPNIGLINSLATFAKVDDYGFISTPYRKVKDGVVTNEIQYLAAGDEWGCVIAQAQTNLDSKGKITEKMVSARCKDDYVMVDPLKVDWMDVTPQQLVSVSTSLIPFLENDDASRALMGSNMQRQAVPLLTPEAPLVGTGMERTVAEDSNVVVKAKRDGEVVYADASRVVVRNRPDKEGEISTTDVYNLNKFKRTNHSTCINQRVVVNIGEKVKKGQLLADGPSTEGGELALGRNVLVAFLSWSGYNFEDAIIISERIVSDGTFTSLHIEEFEVPARDTKLGPEEITRDIPNISEEALANLDESGIITIGSEVKGGDILVGRVTPKGETVLTPEEKLLMAVFGQRASDFKDSSLRVPPGVSGTVVDVRVFNRRGVDKDERSLVIEQEKISEYTNEREDRRRIVEDDFLSNGVRILKGHVLASSLDGLKDGIKLSEADLIAFSIGDLRNIKVKDEDVNEKIKILRKKTEASVKELQQEFVDKVSKLSRGDYMPAGILKSVKVFLAVKRKLQPGDKMSGRHGNKGVVSYVVPVEDMPFLEDGTPVDIILNPLGLPSRMNVGQILETNLGFSAKGLGLQIGAMIDSCDKAGKDNKKETSNLRNALLDIYKDSNDIEKKINSMSDNDLISYGKELREGVPMATPVFECPKIEEIEQCLELAGMDKSGQMQLYDGRTGLPFGDKSTVGYKYILKLHHLVDEKLHARSIGPYSLVTQQPLGGKAQFGGQRFGEMEVWALEAYGAAYTLQEMLTLKSDDIEGRSRAYESIIRGEQNFEPTMPESFKVIMQELKALALDIRCDYKTASTDKRRVS